jgi:hypothetical protein
VGQGLSLLPAQSHSNFPVNTSVESTVVISNIHLTEKKSTSGENMSVGLELADVVASVRFAFHFFFRGLNLSCQGMTPPETRHHYGPKTISNQVGIFLFLPLSTDSPESLSCTRAT